MLYDRKILPIKSMERIRQRILSMTPENILFGDDGPHVMSSVILAELLSQPVLLDSTSNSKSLDEKIVNSSLERSRKIKQSSWKATGWKVAKALLVGMGYITNSELLQASSNMHQWQETRIKPLCRQLLAHPDIFPSLETRLANALECVHIKEQDSK